MKSTSVGVLLLSVVGFSFAADSWATIKRSTHIQAQDLGPALEMLAKEHGFQVLYRTEIVGSLRSRSLEGEISTDEALRALLNGTGLTYRMLGENAITIVPVMQVTPTGATSILPSAESDAGGTNESARASSTQPADRSFWHRLRLAQAETGQTVGGGGGEVRDPSNNLIQEVIVTAQKREQRLQDVPVPVSVVNTAELAQNNQTRLQDFAATIPGLTVTAVGNGGTSNVSIRGINSGAYTPATVAVTVDDVPSYGGLSSIFSPVRPDLDPSDLARVEVLRGPQGTLYGASSMGGLINYVTVEPSTKEASGRVEMGASGISHGDEQGYNVRGLVNVPVSDSFAVRASGFTRKDPGYIDNPVYGKKDINDSEVSGGRLSALWRPFDNVSVKLAALYQRTSGDGQNEVHVPTAGFPATAGLTGFQENSVPGVGQYEQKYKNFSAVVKADFGEVDLVSISAYTDTEWNSSRDLTWAYGRFALPNYGVSSSGLFNSGEVSRFSQELRLSMPLGSKLDWLVGAFYTDEDSPSRQEITALDPTGKPLGRVGFTATPKTYVETAAFTDVTVHFTDRLNVQVGGRQSRIQLEQHAPALIGGYAFGNVTTATQKPTTTTDVFTYLLTPQYTLSDDLMLYARFASGFRSGQGFNEASIVNPALPRFQQPDKTNNFELGVKGSLFDSRLSFDASVYYIDWKDIQITLVDTNSLSYGTNGARAKSEGVELAMQANPLDGFNISGWVAYSNAVLTESLGANSTAYGPDGSRLPYSSHYSGNIALKKDIPVSNDLSGFAQVSATYSGERIGNFLASSVARQKYPAYVQVNLNTGLKTGQWMANVYVNNLTDKRTVIGGGAGTAPAFGRYYLMPRTFGFSLSREF